MASVWITASTLNCLNVGGIKGKNSEPHAFDYEVLPYELTSWAKWNHACK